MVAGRSTQPLAIMDQGGSFWNRRIAVAIVVVATIVFTFFASNGEWDDVVVFWVFAFPVYGIASISHAITNKTLFFVPWKSYKFTIFERWAGGIAFTIMISSALAANLFKHGQ